MIFVTGASRGIGQLLVNHFTAKGEDCAGTYFTSSPTNDDSRLSLVDVRSYDAVSAWVEGHLEGKAFDKLVLVNCAGVSYNSFAHKAGVEDWRNVIDVNLIGAFHAIRALLPHMRTLNFGRIINFSSIVGQRAVPGTSAYAASKAALWGMSRAIAIENAGKNITINNLNLGYFDIGMIDDVPQPQLDVIKSGIPVGRLGSGDNIVQAVEFLIANDYICGSSVDMNGGLF